MSRLTALHIPFVSGHNDAIDARVLPDGVFRTVQNGRLRKSGALALRRGWRPLDMTEMATANEFVAHDIYSYGQSLVALGTLGASNAHRLATYVGSSTTRPWRAYTDAAVPPVTDVQSMGNVADMSEDLWYTSYAMTSSGFGCAAYQYTDGSLSTTITRVFNMTTSDTVAAFSDTSGYVKVFSLGTTIGRVRQEGTNLVYSVLNPEDTSPTFATVATLEAGVTVDSPFDVVFTTGFLHTVVVDGGAATYRRYSSTTGAQSGADKTVTAADVTHFPAIVCDGTTAHVITKTDAADVLSILTFDATGAYTTSAGPTALFSSTAIDASRYCIGKDASVIYVAAQLSATSTVSLVALSAAHTILESEAHRSSVLVSGWVFYTPYAGVGIVRESTHGEGVGSFCYIDTAGPWMWSQVGTAEGSPDNSLTNVPARVMSPSQTTNQVLTGGIARREAFGAPFTVLFNIGLESRRQGVTFGSTLYIAGGVLTQWSGSDLAENGIAAPVISSFTQGTTGGLTQLGTYSYRAVVTWFDEVRGLHRSVVSTAETVTLTGVNDSVLVAVSVGKTLRRNSNVGSNPTVNLFRTEEGPGELFYRVATAVCDAGSDTTALNDTAADSTIIDDPRPYTEGEFGAVSGVLDIAPARAASYVAAMRDRLVLGEVGPAYQVSQTLLPEEPVAFAEPGVSGPAALAYFDSVEGLLTNISTLDDTIVLGTADAIYVAGGEGPNLAGIGSFQSPARLPSDVGFLSWYGNIETSEGLWFISAEGNLYLLPRGGGVPTFAGEAVQDRLTGSVVGCARETEDDTVAWASAGASSVLVVHDITHGYWVSDPLPFTPTALITHQGSMYAVDDDGVVWQFGPADAYGDGASGATAVALQVETGHVQVFGQVGQGRVGAIEVLGEVRTTATLAVDISYDDGVVWNPLGSYAITGTAGDTFQRQFYPANQRGGRFRLRLTMTPTSTTGEGCRLTGFTVYYRTASGPSRLPSASRK